MSSEIITELDSSFSNAHTDVQFPYIEVKTNNTDPLPVVIELLEKGNLPILFTRDNTTYELARIENTALNLAKLLEVYNFTYARDAETSVEIKSVGDLMGVLTWTQQ